MNALVTSVLLLLSASDQRPPPPPPCGRRRTADASIGGWNTCVPEGTEVCVRQARAGQVAVCRACFRG